MHDKSGRAKEKKGQKKEEKKTKDQAENSSNEYGCKNQRVTAKRRRNIRR